MEKKFISYFIIFNSKNIIEKCIEFDGEFHYKPMTNSEYSLKKFKLQQKSDKLKEEFCIKEKISLLRIPFWYVNNIKKKI